VSTFGERLGAAFAQYGRLCVGIDPHEFLLREWGLGVDAAGARSFGLAVVEAAAEHVGIVKPQVAFFERFGSAGFAGLEDVLAAARAAGLLVIADAKRGDVGTTMDGYASAWLAPGSPLEADAVTLSPYLGPESLRQTLITALRHGKGAFVLAATSNPEALPVQSALTADAAAVPGQTVAERVARDLAWANGGAASDDGRLGSVGVVIGATVDRAIVGLSDDALRGIPILAPGFGAQGAEPRDIARLFGDVTPQVIANESRSILSAGPDRIADRIAEHAARYSGEPNA